MLHNGTREDDKGNGMACYTMGQERMTKVIEWRFLHNGTREDDKGNGMACYTMGQERMTKVMEWRVT